MPRNAAISIENDFSRGLITEFSAIAFPEKAATEIWDCDMQLDRKITRRKGFEFEAGYTTDAEDRAGLVVRSFLWKNVLSDGDLELLVRQVGQMLHFYIVEDPLSTEILVSTVDLSSFAASGAPSANTIACHFSPGDGKLFVTHPYLEPLFLTYTASSQTVSATEITPEIRDLVGVTESPALDIDERPTATIAGLSDTHHYNLFNQGWYFV